MIKDQLLKQGSPKPNQDNGIQGRSSGTGQSTDRKEGGSRQQNGKDQSGSGNSNDSG